MYLFHHSIPFYKAVKQAEKWDKQLKECKIRVMGFYEWMREKRKMAENMEVLKELKEKVFVIAD